MFWPWSYSQYVSFNIDSQYKIQVLLIIMSTLSTLLLFDCTKHVSSINTDQVSAMTVLLRMSMPEKSGQNVQ